jgi:cytochrome c553
MKHGKIVMLIIAVLALSLSFAFAAGDVEKGKALFNDPKLGGGTSGKSCNSCHPDGKGLEKAADEKEWKTPAGTRKSLEEAVNTCITMALRGKALDPKSADMTNIVAYIKSLKGKAPAAGEEKPKAKKKAVEGC